MDENNKRISSPRALDLRRFAVEKSQQSRSPLQQSASLASYSEDCFSPVGHNNQAGDQTAEFQFPSSGQLAVSDRYLDAISGRPSSLGFSSYASPPVKSQGSNDEVSFPTPEASDSAAPAASSASSEKEHITDDKFSFQLHPAVVQAQKDIMREMMRDIIAESDDNLRAEIRHVHLMVIKMMEDQRAKIAMLAEKYRLNTALLDELLRLRVENEKLKSKH